MGGWGAGEGRGVGQDTAADPVSDVNVWPCHYHFSSLTMPTKRVLHREGNVVVSVMYFPLPLPNVTNDIAPSENSYGPLTQASAPDIINDLTCLLPPLEACDAKTRTVHLKYQAQVDLDSLSTILGASSID